MAPTDDAVGTVGPTDASAALLDRQSHDGMVVPDYEGYCLANVPGTAAGALGVDVGRSLPAGLPIDIDADVSHVVVVLLDGLGWQRWRRDGNDHRFLSRLAERGAVTPLTSVCPSSTATAITTLHTAATPAEHGVLGWDVHLAEHDDIVGAFPHTVREDVADPAGDRMPTVESAELVAAEPVYPTLADAGVAAHVVQGPETLGTDYADATFRGAEQTPADGPRETARAVRRVLESARGQTYTYAYLPQLDATSHEFGTDSGAYHDALATLTRCLSLELYDRLDSDTAAETLLIATADHGMVDLEPGPAGCLDLSTVDGLTDGLERRPSGEPTPPFADPRLTHLAVRDGAVHDVVDALEPHGVDAFTREEVRELGLYGLDHGPVFERRSGDLVLTHPNRKLVHPAVENVVSHVGMHGGLTPREMVVPFAAARLSDLQ
ncbi:alkaline phosphatase family protein [Halosimplex amylolyticum]|uniref:alkaline phosphatase family protein n=1 Tax=Halosimplex amylolyticum TaxID=3396616 RepID=UPI003F551F7E